RALLLAPGDVRQLTVLGDFTDQTGVSLPASYLSFRSTDATVATVAATGRVRAAGSGGTALLVSSHGILAATVLNVPAPTQDGLPPELTGLVVYPQGVSLPAGVGQRQLSVSLDG